MKRGNDVALAAAGVPNDVADAYEALLQFMYLAPIGLAQTALDGAIEILNPMSAQLLLPLSPHGDLANLFDVLDAVAPSLRRLTADFAAPAGIVCQSLRVVLAAADGGEPGSDARVLSISLLKLDGGRLMAVLVDATLDVRREEQGLARRLSDAARIDHLTQMPNRAAVRERIEQALARPLQPNGNRFAVLFVNCDRFKDINDSLGPAAGDELLGLLGGRLASALRARARWRAGGARHNPAATFNPLAHAAAARAEAADGSVAARVGGDEFVVLVDDLPHADAAHLVSQRLHEVLATPFGIGPRQVHCSVSIGLVLPAQAAGDADAVLQDASIAMVEAKRAGGARTVVFEPAMRDRAAQRGAMAAELRQALARGELFVVYQPVVALHADGTTDLAAGVEALVRWRHPTRGVVPPVDFIPLAEESGLIGAIGRWVLETSCRQWLVWQRRLGARAPHGLAVNLSRAQLAEPGLVDELAGVVRSTGMRPERLQLEVTESLAGQDATIQARLHQLKALGLTLALDDFGTGYSSLACLHQLPVDTVKIDRSFVSQAHDSPHHRVLIGATVSVAASLGMRTVAEGIETAEQAAVVRALGCDKAQGYFFSPPLAAGELERWLLDGEPAAAA